MKEVSEEDKVKFKELLAKKDRLGLRFDINLIPANSAKQSSGEKLNGVNDLRIH